MSVWLRPICDIDLNIVLVKHSLQREWLSICLLYRQSAAQTALLSVPYYSVRMELPINEYLHVYSFGFAWISKTFQKYLTSSVEPFDLLTND